MELNGSVVKNTHFLRAILIILLSSVIGYSFIMSFSDIPYTEQHNGDPIVMMLFGAFIVGWWFLIESCIVWIKNKNKRNRNGLC